MNKKVELLAPAGDLEKLKVAIIYGADAVYFGGEAFSLRAGAGNLSVDEMREGVAFAHERGRRCYLTLNIFPHNEDIEAIRKYLTEIKSIDIDAYLVSDPGMIMLIREQIPDAEIHLSTQANMTNYVTAGFWGGLGVKRLVLARELTFEEIGQIRENISEDMELEVFAHGAMCISYSGRCLLSNFLNQRDANRGECSHPCRWKYSLVEEKRPGEYIPVEEDERGTYFMNSADLCMIDHIPDIIESQVDSIKIEGRMKSVYYVATVVRAYRNALDLYYANPEGYSLDAGIIEDLAKASHRKFTTGFFYGKPTGEDQNYITSDYERDYSFVGIVTGERDDEGYATVQQRNKICERDTVEVFGPQMGYFEQVIEELIDAKTGERIDEAPHPKQKLKIRFAEPVSQFNMLRIRS